MARNEALRKARIQRHWTQSTLAIQLNTTRMTIMRWELGKSLPSLYFREQLCKLFSLTEQELGLDQQSVAVSEPLIRQIPKKRNALFTGREAMLQNIHTLLWEDKQSYAFSLQAIHGLAGIGKTQLALEYAYRFGQYYSAVLWLNAETYKLFIADIMRLVTTLHLSTADGQDEIQMIQALKKWLETSDGWLLIFDNVEDLAWVYSLLPSDTLGGFVLITTRQQVRDPLIRQFNLADMPEDEGALLLLQRARLIPSHTQLDAASAEQRTLAIQICRTLGGFPLALDHAGAYIEETGCDLAGYLERFRHRRSALLSWRSQNLGGYPFSVRTTVMQILEKVECQSPIAVELLRMCVFLAAENIPEALITHGAMHLGSLLYEAVSDLLSLDEAFAILNSFALLRRDSETHLLTMHCLVQGVLRDHLEKDLQRLWGERVLQALSHVFPSDPQREAVTWHLGELLLPHALSCFEHVKCLSWGEQQAHIGYMSAALHHKVSEYLLHRNMAPMDFGVLRLVDPSAEPSTR